MSWEDTFQSWARPPSATEQQKCDNAIEAIKKAIAASPKLQSRSISIFAQGSYQNRTNVRLESDVDVCVLCTDVCFPDFSMSEGLGDADVGLRDDPYTYVEYKNDVEQALRSYFGSAAVTRGNKAFDVHENTYRIDADVVPCFEYRRYHRRSGGGFYFHSGTQLNPDRGGRIINWPQQNYDNGVRKNEETSRRFKATVRIIKRLRYEMEDHGVAAAKSAPSYLIECLVWNVPNEGFGHPTYREDTRWILAYLFNNTRAIADCKEWGEINELKYLFQGAQPWTIEQAHQFIDAAWTFLGFE